MDLFTELPLGVDQLSTLQVKLSYALPSRKAPITLTALYVLSSVNQNSTTVGCLFSVVVDKIVAPLARIQSNEVKWTCVDITLVDALLAPTRTTFHKRLIGTYGALQELSSEPNQAFRFELRSRATLPARGPKSSVAEPITGLRTIHLRGVPASLVDWDREPLGEPAEQVLNAAKVFLDELIGVNCSLRLKLPVQRPGVPASLQTVVSSDPIGLVLSRISGPNPNS